MYISPLIWGLLIRKKCIDHPLLPDRHRSHCPTSTRTGVTLKGLWYSHSESSINLEVHNVWRTRNSRERLSIHASIHQGDFLAFRELKDMCLHILIAQSIRSASSLRLDIFIPITIASSTSLIPKQIIEMLQQLSGGGGRKHLCVAIPGWLALAQVKFLHKQVGHCFGHWKCTRPLELL